jgi:hypothetical protein
VRSPQIKLEIATAKQGKNLSECIMDSNTVLSFDVIKKTAPYVPMISAL